jgi:hypothetical protein
LLKFTGGVAALPENERLGAFTKAGITNVRDLKTLQALANPNRQATLQQYLDIANQQSENPTDLATRSGVVLGTTKAKEQEAANAVQVAAATVGEPLRAKLDEGLTGILNDVQTKGFGPLEDTVKTVDATMGSVNSALGTYIQQLGVAGTLQLALAGGGILKAGAGAFGSGTLAPGQGSVTASGAPTTLPGGTIANPGSSVGVPNFVGAAANAAAGVAATDLGSQLEKSVEDYLHNQLGLTGLNIPKAEGGGDFRPSQLIMNIDTVHAGGQNAEQAFDAIKQQFIQAWNAAMAHSPISGQQGGLYTSGQNPR